MESNYLFKSERLGFRKWDKEDIPFMSKISSDPIVMEFFPYVATTAQTKDFIERMNSMLLDKGYCYFAVDELKTSKLIGFIGLCDQSFESDFTPCIDIGWRLDKKYWNNGYATEGAIKCLEYAFNVLKLNNIKATAPVVNVKSIRVMKKIGMKKQMNFKHPKITEKSPLQNYVCFEIKKEST